MFLSPPLIPDADSARQQAEEELSRGIYHQGTNLWDAFVEWLDSALGHLRMDNGFTLPVPVVIILLAALLIGLAVTLIGSRRFQRVDNDQPKSATLFENDLPADQLRHLANQAAQRGDWNTAVLERYRSLIRELDELLIIEEHPGLTAHFAAQLAGAALPNLAAPFIAAGTLFDDIAYGKLTALPAHDAQLRALEDAVVSLPANFGEGK